MLFKRYQKSFLLLCFFLPVCIVAQTRHYTERYSKYRIFYTLPDSTRYDSYFFVEDSISGNVAQLNVQWIKFARFKNGFIEVRESDMWALFSVEGKLLSHYCRYLRYYPADSIAVANGYDTWQIFNLKGELISSSEKASGCQCWEPRYGQPGVIGEFLSAPACAGYKLALLDKSGTWITEPVFDSIGKFENGKGIAKYNGCLGILNSKGVFTYRDSVGKINLSRIEKQFPGMGPPYKYIDKKQKIVFGEKKVALPPTSTSKKTSHSPYKHIKKIAPRPPSPTAPAYIAPVIIPKKEILKDTTNIFEYHFVTKNSHYKVFWRYYDISKDNSIVPANGANHYKHFKDYFLVDTLSADTFCLIQKTDPYGARFFSSFIALHYHGGPQKIFTLKGAPFLPDAVNLTFVMNDSIIIADNVKIGWSIYNPEQKLLFNDSSRTWTMANPLSAFILSTGKIVDSTIRLKLYALIKPNGQFICDPVFYSIENFDTTGTARARLCNGQTGRVNMSGKFLADSSSVWQAITIASLLADTAYATIHARKYGNNYSLNINPYCYDRHTRTEDKKWVYHRYYINNNLVAENKYYYHRRLKFLHPRKHIRKHANYFSQGNKKQDRRFEGKQIITYTNGNEKTRIVNKHYTLRTRSRPLD